MRTRDSLLEVLANRLAKYCSFIRSPSGPLEFDQQGQVCVTGQIAGPFNNEFLGTRVQIALAERRRVDGIEELPKFGDSTGELDLLSGV